MKLKGPVVPFKFSYELFAGPALVLTLLFVMVAKSLVKYWRATGDVRILDVF